MAELITRSRDHQWRSPQPELGPSSSQPASSPVCAEESSGLSTLRGPGVQAPKTSGDVPPAPKPAPVAVAEVVGGMPPPAPAGQGSFDCPALDDYEVLGKLGHGGMGVVYRARERKLDRVVALKMISGSGYAEPKDLARFGAEAEAVARLQHSNIVQIYRIGEQNGRPYFALEYVDGGSLAQKLRGATLPPQEAACLVETLARAIHFAHQRGIAHRDLKPANVLLTADGTPKITDFGLAKRLDVDIRQTKSGEIMGTPCYMAPEQAGGKSGPPADIWALGAILYEMLTGRPPFRGENVLDTIRQLLIEKVTPPSQLVGSRACPPDLESICLKCLQKDPAKRYPDAATLSEDLRRFANGEPIRAREIGPIERVFKWAKRRPAAAALLLATFVAAMAVAGLLVYGWDNARLQTAFQEIELARQAEGKLREQAEAARQAEEQLRAEAEAARQAEGRLRVEAEGARDTAESAKAAALVAKNREEEQRKAAVAARDEAERERKAALTAKVETETALARLRTSDYYHRIGLAEREWTASNVARAEQLLEEDLDRGPRGWEWHYLKRLWHADLLTFKEHRSTVAAVAFSPDGRQLASADRDGKIIIWNAATGKVLRTIDKHRGPIFSLTFTADGRQLASVGVGAAKGAEAELKIWEAGTGNEISATPLGNRSYGSVFSPDRSRLAYVNLGTTVKVLDVKSGKEITTPLRFPLPATSLAFSSDNQQLASGSLGGTVHIWNLAEEKPRSRLIRAHTDAVRNVAFSPDGKRLASAGEDGQVKLWDAATGNEGTLVRGRHARAVTSLAFSPDGKQLASASQDQTVKVWTTATGQEVFSLRGHVGAIRSVVFSPDGRRLVSAGEDRTVKLWDPFPKNEIALPEYTGRPYPVVFSPDGKRVAAAMGKIVKVWETATGKVISTIAGYAEPIRGLAFSPDSRKLATASHDKIIRVWDLATGKVTVTFQDHAAPVLAVVFSLDGKWIASSGTDQTVYIWEAANGKIVHRFLAKDKPVGRLTFSPNGKWLAAASDTILSVWDTTTRKSILSVIALPSPITSLAFSPDSQTIATGSAGRSLQVVNLSTRRPAWRFARAHADGILALAFSRDGKRLVTSSHDQTIKVWDSATGQEILTLRGHASRIVGVVFDADGHRLLSASADGNIRIWDATPLESKPGQMARMASRLPLHADADRKERERPAPSPHGSPQ